MLKPGIAAGKKEFSTAESTRAILDLPHRILPPGIGAAKSISRQTFADQRALINQSALIKNHAKSFGRGFTLIELLIVLVILVSILAIAWPQMNRRIARSQLKQAATELVEEIANARQLAVDRGETIVLQFSSGTNAYRIGPVRELKKEKQPGSQAVIETIEIGSDSAVQSDNKSQSSMVVEKVFDPSILVVAKNELGKAGRKQFETLQIGDSGGNDEESGFQMIRFSPDGRSQDFDLELQDQIHRIAVRLKIRGLTGHAEIGELVKLQILPEDENAIVESDFDLEESKEEPE